MSVGACRCSEDLSKQQAAAFLEAAASRLGSEEAAVGPSEGADVGACRCAEGLSEQQAAAFLEAAAVRLSSDEAAVQAGALRCVHAIVDHASPALLHRSAGQLYQGKGEMYLTPVLHFVWCDARWSEGDTRCMCSKYPTAWQCFSWLMKRFIDRCIPPGASQKIVVPM